MISWVRFELFLLRLKLLPLLYLLYYRYLKPNRMNYAGTMEVRYPQQPAQPIWKRAWKWVIGGLALWASLIGLYSHYFGNKAEIQFRISSSINVLDINVDLGNLDILYQGESLKKSKEDLRLYQIKVINVGGSTILKSHFDQNSLVGLRFKNSRILDATLFRDGELDAYLTDNVNVLVTDSSTVRVAPVILEPNKSFTLRVLLRHPKNVMPELVAVGKVAGQEVISVVDQAAL